MAKGEKGLEATDVDAVMSDHIGNVILTNLNTLVITLLKGHKEHIIKNLKEEDVFKRFNIPPKGAGDKPQQFLTSDKNKAVRDEIKKEQAERNKYEP